MGVDLAKQVFSASELDGAGRVRQRKDLKRPAFAAWLVQLPPGTVVAMEACSGAHHWARRCIEHGLVPRLMAAQSVEPIRKSQRNKNDRNDAEAIATAARQGNMRRGDSYLRTLLIQGSRSSLQRANTVAPEKATAEQIWIRGLTQRLPFGKVLMAIANKHARQLWAMLARGEDYDAEAWLRHPMVQRPASSRRHAVAA